ncbi:hypothetical protein KC356_g93 [Hortaea werneckii]|nr:hypothetical protein KC356_g93 [Hortaea werneckii]
MMRLLLTLATVGLGAHPRCTAPSSPRNLASRHLDEDVLDVLSNDPVAAAGSYLQLQHEQLCRRPLQTPLYSRNPPSLEYYARPKGIAGPGGNEADSRIETLIRWQCRIDEDSIQKLHCSQDDRCTADGRLQRLSLESSRFRERSSTLVTGQTKGPDFLRQHRARCRLERLDIAGIFRSGDIERSDEATVVTAGSNHVITDRRSNGEWSTIEYAGIGCRGHATGKSPRTGRRPPFWRAEAILRIHRRLMVRSEQNT